MRSLSIILILVPIILCVFKIPKVIGIITVQIFRGGLGLCDVLVVRLLLDLLLELLPDYRLDRTTRIALAA